MGTARRQYTDEFKREAVGLLVSSGRPLSQIAHELGIAPSSAPGGTGVTGGMRDRRSTPIRRRRSRMPVRIWPLKNARLRRENERLRMEREILKKTLRIFSEAPR